MSRKRHDLDLEVRGNMPLAPLSGRIIVDMDATLYYAPFSEACRLLFGANCPSRSDQFTEWVWYKEHGLSEGEFREAVEFVHDRQGRYEPFDFAPETLQFAQKKGFKIIITSQRRASNSKIVDWWLAKHKIPADETYIRPESKITLFRPGDIIIDDKVSYMMAGIRCGAKVISLRYNYNAHMGAYGVMMVDDWHLIKQALIFLGVDDYVQKT